MDIKEINSRASNKAFAKLTMLRIGLDTLKEDLKRKLYGAVTKEEIELCIEGTKKELAVWGYMYKLIETDEQTNN